MLVLTRKLGEKIRIGDQITVSIVELDGRHVLESRVRLSAFICVICG